MEKFGLRADRVSRNSAIELEIIREQASALGRAGRKLRISLENYESGVHQGITLEEKDKCIVEIAQNVWALILQREFLGFTEENLDWIKDNYVMPGEAISRIGQIQNVEN